VIRVRRLAGLALGLEGGPSDLRPLCFRKILLATVDAAPNVDSVERVLWWLFGSSAGAATRIRIILAIRQQPRNALQLAEALGLDYTTVRHHLGVLVKNGLVSTAGDRYGQVYFLSSSMESHWSVFEKIAANVKDGGGSDAAE